MIVRVIYKNEKYDMVKADFLDDLIASRKIEKFRRSSGWARVGQDPMRGLRGVSYNGPERRSAPKNQV